MAGPTPGCAQHPDRLAEYRCEACERTLCADCIRVGSPLLFCSACGERALPLEIGRAASAKTLVVQKARERPYGFADALVYPFRGQGIFMFAATLVSMAVAWLARLSVTGGFVTAGLAALILGLQFKIARSTALGHDELPDWPDYLDWRERLPDYLTGVGASIVQFGPAAMIVLLGREVLFDSTPQPIFWIGLALALWVGSLLWVQGFAAAAIHSGWNILRLDRQLRGLRATAGDSLWMANAVFAVGLAVFFAQAMSSRLPWVGAAIASVFGAYWSFLAPHLSGLVFRRHAAALEAVYE